jgi:hypothetical protein
LAFVIRHSSFVFRPLLKAKYTMSDDTERMHILQLIEDGEISAAEGLRRLDALAPLVASAVVDAPTPVGPEHAPPDRDLEHWKRWWVIPLYIGLSIVLAGALLMYWAYAAGGFSAWFVLAALPFSFGVLVTALAAGTRTAKWIHIRVKTGERDGPKNIALSFPLPLRFSAWLLRTFGHRLPQLKDRGVDDLIVALADTTSSKTPFYIDVQDGKDGEHVQVYIG